MGAKSNFMAGPSVDMSFDREMSSSQMVLRFNAVTHGNDDQLLRDYQRIREAIAFLSDGTTRRPDLSGLAGHLGLSAAHCQKLFKRWCGLSPEEFVAALTLNRAREMLDQGANVFDAAYEAGLSGSGRLHDLFVKAHAMTPGDHKLKGAGLEMSYGVHATPFGLALAVATSRGLSGLAFVNEDSGQDVEDVLNDFRSRWPAATFSHDHTATEPFIRRIFALEDWSRERARTACVYRHGF